MKLLIFLKKWKGGVGVVVSSIKKELEDRGHKVVCISREEDLKLYSSVKSLFLLRKKYKEIIEKERPNIIYTQDWSMALPLIFPFPIYRKKHFCCFHGNEPGLSKILQNFVGWYMGRNLFVVGDSLKRKFSDSILIYNGIDLEKFKPNKKIRKIKNSVGFVNWKTDAYHYNEIKDACKKFDKKLIIADNIPYEKMPEFYQKLECFISLPPDCAGFNMSWIEAMACGVPKIIGNNAGIGKKLKITKIKDNVSILKTIADDHTKDDSYLKQIKKLKLNWGNYIATLLKKWGQ